MTIKLLLDAKLSWRLVNLLQETYPGTKHVDNCELDVPASDRVIWEYARKEGFVIVTNDEDFYEFAVYYEYPPFIVLLRMGNQWINRKCWGDK